MCVCYLAYNHLVDPLRKLSVWFIFVMKCKMTCNIFLVIFKARLSFSYKWISKFQNCMFWELLVPTMLSQVRFNPKTKLAKRHINVGHCSSLGQKKFHHFSDRVTVAWSYQRMTSHFSLHTASFKHHCKIRKYLLCTLYKFYIRRIFKEICE